MHSLASLPRPAWVEESQEEEEEEAAAIPAASLQHSGFQGSGAARFLQCFQGAWDPWAKCGP